MDRILLIFSLICFVTDAFNVNVNIKLFSLGVAFFVATLVF